MVQKKAVYYLFILCYGLVLARKKLVYSYSSQAIGGNI